jgi:hypothetical protein
MRSDNEPLPHHELAKQAMRLSLIVVQAKKELICPNSYSVFNKGLKRLKRTTFK